MILVLELQEEEFQRPRSARVRRRASGTARSQVRLKSTAFTQFHDVTGATMDSVPEVAHIRSRWGWSYSVSQPSSADLHGMMPSWFRAMFSNGLDLRACLSSQHPRQGCRQQAIRKSARSQRAMKRQDQGFGACESAQAVTVVLDSATKKDDLKAKIKKPTTTILLRTIARGVTAHRATAPTHCAFSFRQATEDRADERRRDDPRAHQRRASPALTWSKDSPAIRSRTRWSRPKRLIARVPRSSASTQHPCVRATRLVGHAQRLAVRQGLFQLRQRSQGDPSDRDQARAQAESISGAPTKAAHYTDYQQSVRPRGMPAPLNVEEALWQMTKDSKIQGDGDPDQRSQHQALRLQRQDLNVGLATKIDAVQGPRRSPARLRADPARNPTRRTSARSGAPIISSARSLTDLERDGHAIEQTVRSTL